MSKKDFTSLVYVVITVCRVMFLITTYLLSIKLFLLKSEPDDILHRLDEFIKLFLSEGLNSEFAYLFGLRNV